MVKNHMKRLATPCTWAIKRKRATFVSRPNPGAHPFLLGLPLNVILRDMLNIADSTREVRNIMFEKGILIDGKKVRDHRYLVGLMDILSFEGSDQNYRVLLDNKGKLAVYPVDKKEASTKLCSITGKTLVKKGRMQLNLSDGRNLLVDKGDYKVGDSLLLEVPKQKIVEHFKLEKGALIYLLAGKRVGDIGKVEEMAETKFAYTSQSGETYETLKNYAFVVGKNKPAIKLRE